MINLQPPILLPNRTRIASKTALLALLLLVQLATSLYQLPLNRLVEQRLCRNYYQDRDDTPDHLLDNNKGGDVDESLCKIDDVQQKLAWILGVMETAWIVGDFVMAIPLGFLAEKYGQRVVLWLNLVPRIFMLTWAPIIGLAFGESLPISAIIAAPFLSFLGGDCVFGSITYSLAAGSTDDYVTRATLFGYMSSVSYITNLLGPGLASATMGTVLWLPFLIGICLLLLAVPTISLLPAFSTNRKNQSPSHDTEEEQRLLSSPLLKATRPSNPHNINTPPQPFKSLLNLTKSHIKKIYTTIVRSDSNNNPHRRNLPFLMTSFLLTSLASSDTKLLPQYISKRYTWHFSSVGYLLSCKAVINFILLAFIIPRILKRNTTSSLPINHTTNAEQQRPHSNQDHLPPTNPSPTLLIAAEPSSTTLNITHAHTCLTISLLGATLIALSPTTTFLFPSLAVYALGSALPVFTFSLLKSPYFVIPSPPMPSSAPATRSFPARLAAAWTANTSLSTAESSMSANSFDEDDARYGGAAAHDSGSTSSNTETQLFAIVMMVKTLGSLVGAPLMAALWMRGISLGGPALGIPYIVSAGCYGGALFIFAKFTV